VCPDLFATLPNVFDDEILILFANNCWFYLLSGNVMFESEYYYVLGSYI
jgi:hypothetical protein